MSSTVRPVALADSTDAVQTLVDEPDGANCRGTVVVVPGYGASATSMFPLAHGLTVNGFRCVRVDLRNHVGLSPGSIEQLRLSTQVADIAAVVAAYPGALVVAISLSARPVLRVFAEGCSAAGAVLVTPVVDTRKTIEIVAGKDYFSAVDSGELVEVMGHDIRRAVFFPDCLESGMVSLAETERDVVRTSVPIRMIAGDADPWVDVADVRRVASAVPGIALSIVDAASHKLNRNPVILMRYVTQVIREVSTLVGIDDDPVLPSYDAIIQARSR